VKINLPLDTSAVGLIQPELFCNSVQKLASTFKYC